MLTQEFVKLIFDYDMETGIFTRKEVNNFKLKKGQVVGCLHRQGYVVTKINRKAYKLHRLAWLYVYGYIPEKEIDHIDGCRHNNAILNLREATRSENQRNAKIRSDNKSGYKGVLFEVTCKKWRAFCWANGKQNDLGLFNTAIEASEAYQKFAKENHGQFYRETQLKLINKGLLK